MKKLLAASSFLAAVAVVLAACASGPAARPPANEADAAGERLYRSHCGACHRLRPPSEQTRDRWAWAVDHYGPRAHLDEKDRPLVLEYLQRRAKDAPPTPEAR
jgi:mono/diheme cytochrome c family protein